MTNLADPARAEQHAYYSRTGADYDAVHVDPLDEHANALGWLSALMAQRNYTSLLDVGSGTGRVLRYLKQHQPAGNALLLLRGLEPVEALRAVGQRHGLTPAELVAGDALSIAHPDNAFDIVTAFGVLHHIQDHRRAVAEMCRVAKYGVFISDANNFGQGSLPSRIVKQALNAFGLWRLADLARTGFKGYHTSEGDGVFYSYSLLNDLPVIRPHFPHMYWMSTRPSGPNFYRSAQTLALFATLPSPPPSVAATKANSIKTEG
jgi:ubiquinone/menaquinone biosynthesis C-methylase UbiE